MLETILNRFSSEDNIYQFDSIELDLGVIRKANYENELVYRLEEELTKYFNANITDNGTLRSGKVIVLNDRKLEQFEHFILNLIFFFLYCYSNIIIDDISEGHVIPLRRCCIR